MNNLILPLIIILFASFFQGTFGLGMKYIKPLAWEAWWLLYALVAMIIFPVVWAFLVVPDLIGSIQATASKTLWMAALFGFLWGIGGIMFGISVNYIGVSITYGVVMGLASSLGSIIPLLQMNDLSSNAAVPYIISGVVLLLAGVVICAIAGIKRDESQNAATDEKDKPEVKNFKKGLIIAVICGMLSALLNVGFSNASPVAASAVEHGAIARNASLAAWVVVLLGAFAMNAAYSLFLLIKNNSWSSYGNAGNGKAYLWAVLTGIFWFAALGVYGQGASLMGALGPVIGWPMLLGFALIISNIWAYRSGEWKDAASPFRLMLAGLAVLIVACMVLGFSNSLSA
jgi:L-rhamnose-H+ transport protein